MSTYYNEFDPKAAAWLRELMARNLIPKGIVDERSITDVQTGDLKGFTQCHFFAGVGGWALALRLAGWPDDKPVGTGSCPCQPFSIAGQGQEEADPRHLWPAFRRIIPECEIDTWFGEQVASEAGRHWLAGVQTDLEALAFAFGAADLCAAGVGSPNIRQRLYWVAHSIGGRLRTGSASAPGQKSRAALADNRSAKGGLADSKLLRSKQCDPGQRTIQQPDTHGANGRVDNPASARLPRPGKGAELSEQWGGECGLEPGCSASGLADSHNAGLQNGPMDGRSLSTSNGERTDATDHNTTPAEHRPNSRPDHAAKPGLEGHREPAAQDTGERHGVCAPGGRATQAGQSGGLEVTRGDDRECTAPPGDRPGEATATGAPGQLTRSGAAGFWSDSIWHPCRDGKVRRIPQPGGGAQSVLQWLAHGLSEGMDPVRLASHGFPLAPKVPGRVGLLKGYGNAINPELAAQFILAALEAIESL